VWSKPTLGLQNIVRSAAQLQVRFGRPPAVGKRHDVVELEKGTLVAALSS